MFNKKQFYPSYLRVHYYRRWYSCYYYYCFFVIAVATSGEEGRKSIMKEIELGKELGDSPQENVVKFIGCVTTQSMKAMSSIFLCPLFIFDIYTYFSFAFCLFVCLSKQK